MIMRHIIGLENEKVRVALPIPDRVKFFVSRFGMLIVELHVKVTVLLSVQLLRVGT